MKTLVFFILGWASFASADSSIGSYSYETPSYETPWLDQSSGWHLPQQIDRLSLGNLVRTNARQAFTDPSVLVGVVGVSAPVFKDLIERFLQLSLIHLMTEQSLISYFCSRSRKNERVLLRRRNPPIATSMPPGTTIKGEGYYVEFFYTCLPLGVGVKNVVQT